MSESNSVEKSLRGLIVALVALLAIIAAIFFVLLLKFPAGAPVTRFLNSLLALSGSNATWYVTRSAGLIAYLLMWLSTVWGIAVSSKSFDPVLHRTFTYDLHESLSLLGIGFIILHIVVLLGDKYLPFSVTEILVPFISAYRPIWIGVGIITLYLTLLISVTFYLRRWIGLKAFRVIHVASYLGFFGAALHGLLSGTDSALIVTQVMYAITTLVVVFQTVYWVVKATLDRSERGTVQTADEFSN